jgi:signal transduction histidine kinase
VTVELSSDEEGHLILCVKDEGVGIKPEEMEHLFNRYSRLSSRPTAGESSTGLGLSIVKDQMDAINGKLWCESVYGEGAMFFAEFTQNKNRDDMG